MDKADISAQVEVQQLQIQILIETVQENEKEIEKEKSLIQECKREAKARVAGTDPCLQESISCSEDYREMEEMHAQVVNQNQELLLLLMGEKARLEQFREKSSVQRGKAKEEFFRVKREVEEKTRRGFNEIKGEQQTIDLLRQDLQLKEEEISALKGEKNRMMNEWPDLQDEVERLSEENFALREYTEGVYLSLQQEMVRSNQLKGVKENGLQKGYQPQSYYSFFGSINSGIYSSFSSISSFNTSINDTISSFASLGVEEANNNIPSAGPNPPSSDKVAVEPDSGKPLNPNGDVSDKSLVGGEGADGRPDTTNKQGGQASSEAGPSEGGPFWQRMGLPVGQACLQYFSCCNAELKGGWFYVCEEYIVFETTLKQHELEGPILVPIREITQIDKRNMAIKFIPGKGRSISIRTMKQGEYLFRSFLQRDAAASLLLKRCEGLTHSVLTTRDNKPDDFSENREEDEPKKKGGSPEQSSSSSSSFPPLCPPSPLRSETPR